MIEAKWLRQVLISNSQKKGRNLYNGKPHKMYFSLEWRLHLGGMSGMD